MLLTMHVVNSNGECASPHYDNTVQPRLSRFLDYPDLFLCSKFFMNINIICSILCPLQNFFPSSYVQCELNLLRFKAQICTHFAP